MPLANALSLFLILSFGTSAHAFSCREGLAWIYELFSGGIPPYTRYAETFRRPSTIILDRFLKHGLHDALQEGVPAKAMIDSLWGVGITVGEPRDGFCTLTYRNDEVGSLQIEPNQEFKYLSIYGAPPGLSVHKLRMKLIDELKARKVLDVYFERNPDIAEERKAYARRNSKAAPVRPPVVTENEALASLAGKVTLVADYHDEMEKIQWMRKAIETGKLDWVGLELRQSVQPALNDFMKFPEGDPGFVSARKKIFDVLKLHPWRDPKLEYRQDSNYEEHPEYQLMLLAKRKGMKVVALDTAAKTDVSTVSNFDEPYEGLMNIGMASRNAVMAKNMPEGSGVALVGYMHFQMPWNTNVQDFVNPSSRQVQLVWHATEHFPTPQQQ